MALGKLTVRNRGRHARLPLQTRLLLCPLSVSLSPSLVLCVCPSGFTDTVVCRAPDAARGEHSQLGSRSGVCPDRTAIYETAGASSSEQCARSLSLSVCACVCMCVRVCVYVCVCVFVSLFFLFAGSVASCVCARLVKPCCSACLLTPLLPPRHPHPPHPVRIDNGSSERKHEPARDPVVVLPGCCARGGLLASDFLHQEAL